MIELPITTHSMLTTFRRCPRQTMYQFVDCLRPKEVGRPLRMGGWFHHLLEAHYQGQNWRVQHRDLKESQLELHGEEQTEDVAAACFRLMESYLWYYQLEKKYGWKVVEVELELETTWPDGTPHKCKLDLLVEINGELWIIDHKLRSKFPKTLQRLRDSQSLTYIWVAHRNGLDIKGFMWNYVRMAPPSIPQRIKSGALSRKAIQTDYLTLKSAIEKYNIDPRDYDQELRDLRAVYWRPGKTQLSPFFKREIMDRDSATVARMVKEMYRTRKRLAGYSFDDRDSVERVIGEDCAWHCSYTDICNGELFNGQADLLIRNHYDRVDPLDYYTGKG